MEESSNNFGALFRAAREQAGRQLSDVAAELHINIVHLQALEDEQFEKLPSHAFARGYIRAYCRALEADPEPLLKAYLRSAPKLEEWHANEPIDEETRASRLPLVLGTAAVAATVVALFVVWFLGSGYLQKEPTVVDEAQPADATPTPVVAAEPVPRLESGAEPSVGPAPGGEESDTTPTAADQPEQEMQKADEQSAAPAADAAAEAADDKPDAAEKTSAEDSLASDEKNESRGEQEGAASDKPAPRRGKPDPDDPDTIRAPQGNDRVEITLKDKSWVDIRDANGYRLLHGLYLPGASKTLVGKAPFQVFLGNAPAVELKAGGQPFDLSGFVRSNNTARFAVLKQQSDKR